MTSSQNQSQEISRSSKQFFSGTLMSRVLGLVRDVLMAYCFGSHASVAALMVAFRLSNLFRRLLGEGALHAAFVPAYEKIRLDSEKKASAFFLSLSVLLLLSIFSLIFLFEGGITFSMKKGVLSASNREIFALTAVLIPSLFFVCHAAFCSSYLQCQKIYFVPALSPALFNLFWIAGLWFSKALPAHLAMVRLAWFLLFGLIAQWGILVPKVSKFMIKHLKQKDEKSKLLDLKSSFSLLGKPLLLGLLGVSTTQINNALDALFARFVDLKGPAFLWYAIRLEQVPLAIFGVALAGALLPPLSRAYLKDKKEYAHLLDFSFSRALGLLLPCCTALLVLAPAIINLVYCRGQFDLLSAKQTTFCLWAYAAGLPFQGLCLILAPAFYAQQNYKVTTKATFYSMLTNIMLNSLFAFGLHLGAWGIALATSLSALFQMLYLLTHLMKSQPSFSLINIKKSGLKIMGVCLLSTTFVACFLQSQNGLGHIMSFPKGLYLQMWNFASQTFIFLSALFSFSWLFKVGDVLSLLHYIPGIKIRKDSSNQSLNSR